MSDTQETKAEKFVRLKDNRLAKVLDALRILGNISNVRDYDYTPEQAAELLSQIQEKLDVLKDDFGVPRTAPSVPSAEEEKPEAAVATDLPVDPSAPASPVKGIDGKRLKVRPGEWDDLALIHVGPHLGIAMEALMDGDNETALEYLKKVMTA